MMNKVPIGRGCGVSGEGSVMGRIRGGKAWADTRNTGREDGKGREDHTEGMATSAGQTAFGENVQSHAAFLRFTSQRYYN